MISPNNMMRAVAVYVGAGLVALAPPTQAAEPGVPVVLKPVSHWNMDYADDSCRLARIFGEGEQQTVFYIERYEPGDAFFAVVAGKPLDARLSLEPTIRFGPDGHEKDDAVKLGVFGEFEPAVMVTGMTLLPLPDADERKKRRKAFDLDEIASDTDIFGQQLSPAQESIIEWVEVQRGKKLRVRLELGSMGEPMAAMRKCTDELLGHWGIDVEAHQALTRAAAPVESPGKWVTSRDYPTPLLRRGEQGLVQFRLSVDAQGNATQCHIQKSTRPAGFDEAVCKALMRNARFTPALGAEGRPIASYWRSTVRFEMSH